MDAHQTLEGRRLVEERYFTSPFLKLEGADGITQEWDGDDLVALRFPDRFLASRSRLDLQLTFHEMGHLITISEARCVRSAFGFGGGIPELGWEPWRRSYDRVVSVAVEGKAFAWENILMKQVFGIDVPVEDQVSSLQYTTDFFYYPGENKADKLAHAAAVTQRYLDRYREGPPFDELWKARIAKLPELMAAETRRRKLYAGPPAWSEPLGIVAQDWNGVLHRFGEGADTVWAVDLDNPGNEHTEREEFDTREAAQAWFGRVVANYEEDVEPAPGP